MPEVRQLIAQLANHGVVIEDPPTSCQPILSEAFTDSLVNVIKTIL